MYLTNYFLIAFVLCGALAAEISEINEPEGRVVGGSDAPDGAVPYIISLQRSDYNNIATCGGAIIADQWILTAAQCVRDVSPKDLSVLAGTNSITSGGTRYKVDKIVIHEKFNAEHNLYDIALLRTTEKIQFTEKVKAIEIATEDPKPGDKCKLSGWGYHDQRGRRSHDKLQWLDVKIISEEDCKANEILKRAEKNFPITESHICTLNKKGEGTCKGDSGGSLACNNKSAAIVSFNVPCARGVPDVYTRTTSYSKWIKDNMEANKP
ncbi:chymotrypsin-2-like isoform X2 [Pieris napi]|uniref:chymotrypsin-2-like isoform X2 n=1 Tax=Pieris napi TaxID=78633 RepID=UPI001FBACF84|nr:chymotrypsin-2-like isoform X2 [Pieris napi]